MSMRWLCLMLMVILTGCNPGGSPSAGFGIKDEPTVNINLLSVNPANIYLEINETKQFFATGGAEPYTFQLVSGGGFLSANGFYAAPSFQTNAVIKVIDGKLKEAFGTIIVNVPISITPTSITISSNSSTILSASGGIPPFTYSIVTGQGTVNAQSGVFSSLGSPPGTTIVKVTDTSMKQAYAAVIINPSLIISPTVTTIGKGESAQFSTVGGSQPYVYSLLSGTGSITSGTGVYSATNSPGTSFVRITDNAGNTADAPRPVVNTAR